MNTKGNKRNIWYREDKEQDYKDGITETKYLDGKKLTWNNKRNSWEDNIANEITDSKN